MSSDELIAKRMCTFCFVLQREDQDANVDSIEDIDCDYVCYTVIQNPENVDINWSKPIQPANYQSDIHDDYHLVNVNGNLEPVSDGPAKAGIYPSCTIDISCCSPSDSKAKSCQNKGFHKYTNIPSKMLSNFVVLGIRCDDDAEDDGISRYNPTSLNEFLELIANVQRGKVVNIDGRKGKLVSVWVRLLNEVSTGQKQRHLPDLTMNAVNCKDLETYLNYLSFKSPSKFGKLTNIDVYLSNWHIGSSLDLKDITYPQKVRISFDVVDKTRDLLGIGMRKDMQKELKKAEKKYEEDVKRREKEKEEAKKYWAGLNKEHPDIFKMSDLEF